MPVINFNIHDRVGLLTVNRPEIRNAFNVQAIEEFAAAIEQARTRAGLRALVITGAGKAFISGGDIQALHNYKTEAEAERLMGKMTEALNQLSALPCLAIAAMEGPARGGGWEVALACDWRVAAEDADIGFVQIRLALTPGWGSTARLGRLVGYAHALDLLALGRVLTATEAHRLGIVTHLAPPGEALKSALSIAQSLAGYDLAVLQSLKRILRTAQTGSFAEAQAVERAEFPKLWAGEAHLKAVERFLRKAEET